MKIFTSTLMLNGRLTRFLSLLVLLVSLGTITAHAQALAINNGNSELLSVNVPTGTTTVLANLSPNPGGFLQGGLCLDDELFIFDTADDGRFFSVAMDGTVTTIGNITTNGTEAWVGLDRNPNTGDVYAVSSRNGASSLYTVDLATGTATFVSALTGIDFAVWIIVDDLGNGFVADLISDNIFPVDLATGAVGAGVPFTVDGNPGDFNFGQDMDFDCNSATGEIFGYISGGTSAYGQLDPVTGAFTTILAGTPQITGFSFCADSIIAPPAPPTPAVEPIPTMSEWALLIFGLLIMNLSVVFIQKKELI